MKKTVYSILVLILFVLSWNDCYAWQRKRFKVCNNTGGACSAFQADFTGGGGNLAAKIIVNPCGYAPTITITPSTPGDIVFIFWGTNCVAPGACVTFDVYTNNGPLTYTAGYWMNTTLPTFPGVGAITMGTNLFNIPILILNANCFLPSGNLFRSSNPFFQNGLNSFFDVFADVAFCQPLPVSGSGPLSGTINVHGNSSSGTFSVAAPATVLASFDYAENDTKFYNTEMVSLNMGATGMPSSMMIRESPTLASTGKTTVTDIGGGQYAVNSFFDVYTELSVDGGQTWQVNQSGPAHLEFFDNTPASIPTLSEWGLIIFAAILIITGVMFIIRRKRTLVV